MTILDTLPALPWRFIENPNDCWYVDNAAGNPIFDHGDQLTADQAQALVALVNGAAAMREALESIDAYKIGGPHVSETEMAAAYIKAFDKARAAARAALALIEEGK